MFSEREMELVRKSWEPVAQQPEVAAVLFYDRLFETSPAVRPLFKGDIKDQGKKLMQMVGVAVNNMERIEEIVPALKALGAQHVDYGAEAAHYPVVGAVLLETLATALGEEFCEETRGAWAKTYDALASVMTDT